MKVTQRHISAYLINPHQSSSPSYQRQLDSHVQRVQLWRPSSALTVVGGDTSSRIYFCPSGQ